MNIYKKNITRWRLVTPLLILALLAQFIVPSLMPFASATTTLTQGTVRFDRMNASQATTGTVCAKTNANAQTEAAVGVTFPTGYTVSTTLSNWAVNTTNTGTNWPTGATAWPGIAQPSAGQIVGQIVVFGSTDLAVNTLYCFNWTNTASVSIKSSATSSNTGTIITCNANTTACAGLSTSTANLDTSNWATASVAASCGSVGCDQIAVTATVTPSFAFSLSANTAGLGNLSTSGTAATAINASISTNALSGWQMWGADPAGTPGLTSTAASHTIAYSPAANGAVHTLSAEEGYNLGVGATAGGTCTGENPDAKFTSGGTSFRGGGLDNTMRSLASATGTANACLVPLTVNAMITATTQAANDYAGTMTIVAAGNF